MIHFTHVTASSSSYLEDDEIKEPIELILPKTGILYLIQKPHSGSDTFLRLISGDIVSDQGEITDGIYSSPSSWKGKAISVLKKNMLPFPSLSVEENLFIDKQEEEKAKQILSFVGLSGKEKMSPCSLTEEDQNRAGLASILMKDIPTILVRLSSLSEEMMNLLKTVSKERLVLIPVAELPDDNQEYLEFSDGRIFHAPSVKESIEEKPTKSEPIKPGLSLKIRQSFVSFRKNAGKAVSALVLFSLSLAGLASLGSVAFYNQYDSMPEKEYVNVSGSHLSDEVIQDMNKETGADFRKVQSADSPFIAVKFNTSQTSLNGRYFDAGSLAYFPQSYHIDEGRLPSSETDLMLSDAMVFVLRHAVVLGNTATTLGENESIIGKSYGSYTVSGVLNTGFDKDKYESLFSSYTKESYDEFSDGFFQSYRDLLMVSTAEFSRIEQASTAKTCDYLAKIDDKTTLIRVVKYCEKDPYLVSSSYATDYFPGGTFWAILVTSFVLLFLSMFFFIPLLTEDSIRFRSLQDKLENLNIKGASSFAVTKIVLFGIMTLMLSSVASLPVTFILNEDFWLFKAASPIVFPYLYPIYLLLIFFVLFLPLIFLFFYHRKKTVNPVS